MFHGSESRRQVPCPKCGTRYPVRVTVRRHREFGVKRWFSIDGQREYLCSCGERFSVDDAVYAAKKEI